MKQHGRELQYVQNNNIFIQSQDIVLRYIPDKGHYWEKRTDAMNYWKQRM